MNSIKKQLEIVTRQMGEQPSPTKPNPMTETQKAIELEISDNVHPNLDGSPWGWLVLKGTRIRVATYSGREEKARCKQIIEQLAGRLKSLEEKDKRIGELENDNKEVRNALNILYLCLQEAPVDFLGTGSDSKSADRDERKWNKTWQEAYEKIACENQPPPNNF